MTEKGYKRILIVQVNWLGDVLFSTPLIRAVREKFKNAYIACMAVPRVKSILENNPHLDEIIIYDEEALHKGIFGKWRFINMLRSKKFDLAILLHRSLTRTLITVFSGIRERAGYVTGKRRLFLTLPIEPPDYGLHKAEYFLKIAEALGCDTSHRTCEFFIGDGERRHIEEELSKGGVSRDDFLVVVNPGGNWPPKRWSEERFSRLGDILIKKYNAKVALSGGDTDKDRAERIKKKMEESPVILSGKTSLKELGALLERADCVISSDSGPMHIAVAMRSKVIALFGPTSPRLTGPCGGGNYRVIQKPVGCEVPCYELGCEDYRCMDAITVDDVVKAFEEICKVQ